jgi:allantoinase
MSDFDLSVVGNMIDHRGVTENAWFAVRAGRVTAQGVGAPPKAREQVDARGLWVIPGVVDGQVHSGSQINQEGLGRASKAALAGGVTTMVDMPYDDPYPVNSRSRLDLKIAEVERTCHSDVALYGTLTAEHGLEAAHSLIEGGVCAFKFSTFEAAPGRFPRVEYDDLLEAFRLIAPSGLACGVHNQDQELTRKNIARLTESGDTGWDAFLRAHTPLIEVMATSTIYELGALTGARAHPVHVSLGRGFEICNMYRAAGHAASIETCVQYLMLDHEEHTRRLGARVKHYPPIRPRAEVDRLWHYIARNECSFVSSDHVSWGLERKGHENVFKNSSGGPGLETLLPAFWTGCEEHGLGPAAVVQQLCLGPAKHFLLDDRKGHLGLGADADFVLVKPDRYRFDPATSQSAVTWSAFEGRKFHARVVATWLRGVAVWDGDKILNEAGSGKFQRPKALTL